MPDVPQNMHPLLWILALALFVGIPAAATVAVARISSRQKAHGEVIDEVREQVSNDHPSNMRDDLDRHEKKIETVDTKIDVLTGTVDAFRQEIAAFMRETRRQMAEQDRIAAIHHPESMRGKDRR